MTDAPRFSLTDFADRILEPAYRRLRAELKADPERRWIVDEYDLEIGASDHG